MESNLENSFLCTFSQSLFPFDKKGDAEGERGMRDGEIHLLPFSYEKEEIWLQERLMHQKGSGAGVSSLYVVCLLAVLLCLL